MTRSSPALSASLHKGVSLLTRPRDPSASCPLRNLPRVSLQRRMPTASPPSLCCSARAMIVPASACDTPALLALAEATNIFQPGEVQVLLGETLSKLHAGELAQDHQAHVWIDSDSTSKCDPVDDASREPRGWMYFGPSDTADGAWDLWWIGVHPDHQGKGIGRELLRFCEAQARAKHGRELIIETNSSPAFLKTRTFYLKQGYVQSGRIADCYGEGEDKIIFAKQLGGDKL